MKSIVKGVIAHKLHHQIYQPRALDFG